MKEDRTLDAIARSQAVKTAWMTISGPLFAELDRQMELCDKAILRECSKIPAPDQGTIQELAAEKRVLYRLRGRFNQLCAPPKDA